MTVLMKDWNVINLADSGPRLHGFVFGHPKFMNGTEVITSEIQSYDPKEGVVKTVFTEYKLDDHTLGEYLVI
jgi:hypothetical protein